MLVPVVVAPPAPSTALHNAYGHKKLMATNSIGSIMGIGGPGNGGVGSSGPGVVGTCPLAKKSLIVSSSSSGSSSNSGGGSSVIVGVGVGVAAAVTEPAAYASVAVVNTNSTNGGTSSHSVRQPNKRKFSTFF